VILVVMAVVAVAVGGGVVERIVENERVAVRAGRKFDDDDDSPANSSVGVHGTERFVNKEVRIVVLHACQGARCYRLCDNVS
jgi:hypothetical protein